MGGALSGKSKPQTASGVETKDAKQEAQPEAQPKAQPEAQPEAQPKAQPEAQPEAPPEVQPVGDLEDKPTDASDLNKDVEKEVRTIIILFGPPGSGKGTHAPTIVAALDTPQLSTGDMLRAAVAAGSEIGMQAEAVMKSGALVSDEIVTGIIAERIKQPDCAKGFLLDGFPRTLAQAQQLDALLQVDGESVSAVVALAVPDEELEVRIYGRWVHEDSGRSYHVTAKQPKSLPDGAEPSTENMLDDETGEPLMQRKDDTPDALKIRLSGYHEMSKPLLQHYAPVVKNVDVNLPMSKITPQVDAAVAPFKKPP